MSDLTDERVRQIADFFGDDVSLLEDAHQIDFDEADAEALAREVLALRVAAMNNKARAVRLAVVEVAEPEPPRPGREVGPSGYEYDVHRGENVNVRQWLGDRCLSWFGVADHDGIPPADRALVARLLGEEGS